MQLKIVNHFFPVDIHLWASRYVLLWTLAKLLAAFRPFPYPHTHTSGLQFRILSHSFPWGFWYSLLSATFHLSQQVFLSSNLRENRLRFGYFSLTNLLYCWKCACSVMTVVTLRTAAHQPPLSMGFSRQGYRSGLPSPTPGDLPDPGIKSPELACEFFTTKPHGKPASFTVGQIYILSPWLLDLLIKRYSGRNGLRQPFKKALSPSTRAMSTYLLRIFITKRIYMKTLAWIFHPVTQS